MHFTVTFKRHVCKFFFINNMADWHHACVRYYNEIIWIRETGPLTQGETNALDAFARIAWKYPYGGEWPGRPIVAASSEEQAFVDVEDLTGAAYAERLRDAFLVMEPRFKKIWARDEGRLIALAERLGGALYTDNVHLYYFTVSRRRATGLPYAN